jgi:hypothetical protein
MITLRCLEAKGGNPLAARRESYRPMPGTPKRSTQRKIQLLFGLLLAGICYLEVSEQDNEPILTGRSAVVMAGPRVVVNPIERLLREDPLSALKELRARHLEQVKDYRCTLVKQELLPSGLSAEQELEVLFRQEPYSVVLHWVRNAGLANRAIYVKGKWIDDNASDPNERDLAMCQPGKLGAFFLKSIKMPIHGPMAHETARRSIDEFGFGRTLDLLIKYCDAAKARSELKLEFQGEGRYEGRPVWILRRHLPYSKQSDTYPDRTAEIYIDKELHIPVAVYCYSDDDQKPENLLGKYEFRDIHFNVGLTDTDFDPETYGM